MGVLSVVQFTATTSTRNNLATCLALVEKCVRTHRADFVCLPEAADYIGTLEEDDPGGAILNDELVSAYSACAKRLNVWLSFGMHYYHPPSSQTRAYNAHIVLDSRGEVKARYDKIHLFDAEGAGFSMRESDSTIPGEPRAVVIRDTPIGTVGLTTCYDMRFPHLYQRLREAGAEVILVPSAFMIATGRADHWHVLLRARAIENQVYIAAAAQVGRHNEKRESYGHSLVVDPYGKVLCDLGGTNADVGAATIDLQRLREVRERMPLQRQIVRDVKVEVIDSGSKM